LGRFTAVHSIFGRIRERKREYEPVIADFMACCYPDDARSHALLQGTSRDPASGGAASVSSRMSAGEAALEKRVISIFPPNVSSS
jgi:hypothetical protein